MPRSSSCLRLGAVLILLLAGSDLALAQAYPPPLPPPPVEAAPPPPPPRRGPVVMVWVPGHWRWVRHEYVWVAGHYARAPRPGAAWIPGHWVERPRGWVWIPGHWR